MENPKIPATMEIHSPEAKTLDEASGSSGFYSFSEDCTGITSDLEVQGLENGGIDGGDICVSNAEQSKVVDCLKGEKLPGNADEVVGNENNSPKVECVSKSSPADDPAGSENVVDKSHGADPVRKIEVSGNNLSLVVDFSDSVSEGNQQGNFSQTGAKECNFAVGDLVWLKAKNDTWWPARVNDPSCASADAPETNHKDLLPVSYFGHNHVMWCLPSQFKPFGKNFEQMLGQSKAKKFLKLTEKALEEFGKHLKAAMICPCVSKESEIVIGKSDMFRDYSLASFEPTESLAQLKNLAQGASVPEMLALTVLQSRISAFYHSIGHPQVPLKQLYEGSEDGTAGPSGKKFRKKSVVSSSQNHSNDVVSGEPLINSWKKKREKVAKIRNANDVVEKFDDVTPCTMALESRERKKSRYLSYPYIMGQNTVRTETDNETVQGSSDHQTVQCLFVGSPSLGTSNAKRLRTKWFKKFISDANPSARAELATASLQGLLSELHIMAVDCRYTKEIEDFDLTEWFFSKFRISMYHDESIYEMQCKEIMNGRTAAAENDSKDIHESQDRMDREQKKEKKGKKKTAMLDLLSENMSVDKNDLPNTTSQQMHLEDVSKSPNLADQEHQKKRRRKKMTPDLSVANANVDTNAVLLTDMQQMHPGDICKSPGQMDQEKKTRKRKKKAMPDLLGVNLNCDIGNTLLETDSQQMCPKDICKSPDNIDREQKPKKRRKKMVPDIVGLNMNVDRNDLPQTDLQQMCPNAPTQAAIIPDLNSAGAALNFTTVDSLKASMDHAPPEKEGTNVTSFSSINGETVKLGSVMINFQATAQCSINSVPGPSNGKEITFTHDINSLSGEISAPQIKKRRRRKKGTLAGPPEMTLDGAIPDLNGTNTEQSASTKDVQDMNALPPETKPKYNRRRGGKDAGTTLHLSFAPGVSTPSIEDLISSFSAFGPLNSSETQILDDSGSVRISFLSTNDAVEAVRSLKQNNPYGESLTNYRLQQKPTVGSTVKKLKSSPRCHPGEVAQPPQLDFIRQNLMMMTSMLEKAGDSLSPEMRIKLESEIKGLLGKVSSMPSSSNT